MLGGGDMVLCGRRRRSNLIVCGQMEVGDVKCVEMMGGVEKIRYLTCR